MPEPHRRGAATAMARTDQAQAERTQAGIPWPRHWNPPPPPPTRRHPPDPDGEAYCDDQ